MGNPLNALSEFAESLWSKYIKRKVQNEISNAVFWFKAQVVTNHGNGYLSVQKPFDSVITVRCVPALRRSTVGSQVTVLSFGKGNAANCVAIGNGSMDNQTVIADDLYIGGHDSPVGTIVTKSASGVALSANTVAFPVNMTLTKGAWILEVRATFGTSQTTASVRTRAGMNDAQSVGTWNNRMYGAQKIVTTHVVAVADESAVWYATAESSVANTVDVYMKATRIV